MESSSITIETAINNFIIRQKQLLDLELKSETESKSQDSNEEFQKGENGLTQLKIVDVSVGLYGRTVIALQHSNTPENQTGTDKDTIETRSLDKSKGAKILLPSHRFTVGDQVELLPKKRKGSLGGVISKVSEESISIALFESTSRKKSITKNPQEEDEEDEQSFLLNDSTLFALLSRSNVEVHRKMLSSLEELHKHGIDHPIASAVLTEIFSTDYVKNQNKRIEPDFNLITPHSPFINKSQIEAISYSLSTPLSLIHGPPGTGKTTTLVELIHQSLTLNPQHKILVTASSNIAVDTILHKCSLTLPKKFQLLRIGHPARIHHHTLTHSLEHKIHTSDEKQILNDIDQELKSHLQALSNFYCNSSSKLSQSSKKKRLTPAQRRNCKQEITTLRKELKHRHKKLIHSLMTSAHVVFATNIGCATLTKKLTPPPSNNSKSTLSSSASSIFTQNYFDLLIMDEAAQSLPSSSLLPILLAKKCVLAGDDRQLPPTITSQKAKAKNLDETFFDLIRNPNKRKLLDTQYRMNEKICLWASDNMYEGRLKCAENVKDHLLCDLDYVDNIPGLTDVVMMLIDTAGCDYWEDVHITSGSRCNKAEGDIVHKHIEKLINAGVKQENIAVITPYNAQVELLRNLLRGIYPNLEIKSVDGFQGGEKDAVILSLVRSNEKFGESDNGIGFLKDRRRINVAVTRAKKHVAVVCDSETVSRDGFLKTLIQWIEENGDVRSALEYLDGNNALDGAIQSADLDIVEKMFEDALNVNKGKGHVTNVSNPEIGAENNFKGSPIIDEKKITKSNHISSNSSEKKNFVSIRQTTSYTVNPDEVEETRQKLKTEIETFAQNVKQGDELKFSSSLTKLQRLMIHEIAEEYGFGHQSVGKEDLDRRIIITKKGIHEEDKAKVLNNAAKPNNATNVASKQQCIHSINPSKDTTDASTTIIDTSSNDLLKTLALERMDRQRKIKECRTDHNSEIRPKAQDKKKNKKSKKGKNSNDRKESASLDSSNLDDMAFLDGEVQKVQTSHGRKVEGSGAGYRSIINGILIEKPKPKEVKKDAKASAALKAKLKSAKDDRKTKSKKKK